MAVVINPGIAFGAGLYEHRIVVTRWVTADDSGGHWNAEQGGRRRDAGDDPAVFLNYPGRIGFTDANSSPEPNDYNEHGGIYLHLNRYGKSFVNFGNGYEFALIEEPGGVEPTGARQHANVPMEKGFFSRICGSCPAPVADPTYGTGRFPSTDTSESRTPFWQSVSPCC